MSHYGQSGDRARDRGRGDTGRDARGALRLSPRRKSDRGQQQRGRGLPRGELLSPPGRSSRAASSSRSEGVSDSPTFSRRAASGCGRGRNYEPYLRVRLRQGRQGGRLAPQGAPEQLRDTRVRTKRRSRSSSRSARIRNATSSATSAAGASSISRRMESPARNSSPGRSRHRRGLRDDERRQASRRSPVGDHRRRQFFSTSSGRTRSAGAQGRQNDHRGPPGALPASTLPSRAGERIPILRQSTEVVDALRRRAEGIIGASPAASRASSTSRRWTISPRSAAELRVPGPSVDRGRHPVRVRGRGGRGLEEDQGGEHSDPLENQGRRSAGQPGSVLPYEDSDVAERVERGVRKHLTESEVSAGGEGRPLSRGYNERFENLRNRGRPRDPAAFLRGGIPARPPGVRASGRW